MAKRFSAAVLLLLAQACARTDARLAGSVQDRLARRASVPAGAIAASARDGIVTLSGTVSTPADKDLVLRTARETSGVRSVVDAIHVTTAATPGEVSGSGPSSLTGAMPPGGRSPAASPPGTAGDTDRPPPR